VQLWCNPVVRSIAFGACLLLAPELYAQERVIEYVVVKGDTCEGIARKLYGSPKFCYKMLSKYNKFDKKYKLEPGQVLRLATREELENEPDAELAERRGAVEARKPDDQSWFKATLGEKLWSRWRVSTEQRASARIEFTEDQSSLDLRESTLVVIYGPDNSKVSARAGARAELERGTLRSRLGELSGKPSTVTVETPAASASLSGGQTIVSVEAKGGTTRVANHTGKKVEVSGRDPVKKKVSKKRVKLPPNTGSKVEPGKEPTPPRPLPSAPGWDASSPIIAMTWGDTGSAQIDWTSASQAANVRLELSEREDGTGLLDAQLVPGNLSRARLEGLPIGEYWVRLAAIDADGFEGIPGPARRLVVKLATPVWIGRAEGQPILPGQVLTLDGARCAIGDGEPVQRLVMPRAGSFAVRCVEADGAALPSLAVEVSPVALVSVTPGEQVVATSGQPVEISFETEPALEQLAVVAPEGWRVASAPARDGARWSLTLVADEGASAGALQLVTGEGGEVGALPLAAQQAPGVVSRPDVIVSYPWSIQPMLSYSALYNDGYKLGDVRLRRGWRSGLRLGRELGAGVSLELEGYAGRLLPESQLKRVTVAGGQLGALWRPLRGLSPFVQVGSGVELGFGDAEGMLWTVSGGAGLLSPVTERLDFRLEVRQVVAPLGADGVGMYTSAGLGLSLRF
jgi:hypothetical protein